MAGCRGLGRAAPSRAARPSQALDAHVLDQTCLADRVHRQLNELLPRGRLAGGVGLELGLDVQAHPVVTAAGAHLANQREHFVELDDAGTRDGDLRVDDRVDPRIGRSAGPALQQRLLDEPRAKLVAHRTRLINQLHALLRDLAPVGRTPTSALRAARVLVGVRPAGPVEAIGKQMAGQFVGDVRAVGIRLRNLTRLIADTVTAHGTRLPHDRRCRADRGSSADRASS